MFDAAADPAAEAAPPVDPTIAVCERHLRLLAEVGEIAMEVTRALGASATAAAREVEVILSGEKWDPETARARALAGSKDAADAFQKVTRALRLTLALEKATAETLRDLRAGVLPERKTATPAARSQAPGGGAIPAASPRDALRETLRDLVTDAIAAADITPARELSHDLNERLTEADRFGPLLKRPLREVVEHICAEIRLAHDELALFGDELEPPPRPPPPEWMITGPPHAPELMCVRREIPPPTPPPVSGPRRE